MFLHYFRTTDDGRVLMGSGTGPIGYRGVVDARFSEDAPTAARAEAGLRRLLPGLDGAGPSWLGGQILASLVLGADDEWTRLPLATRRVPTLPPEPFRRVGGGLVRHAIMRCEEADERGVRAPLYARAASSLPRLLRMELGTR